MLKIPALASKADLASIFALMGSVNEHDLLVDKVYQAGTLEFVSPEMGANEKIGLYEGVLVFRSANSSMELPRKDLSALTEYFVKTE
jgi:hypothetical protein